MQPKLFNELILYEKKILFHCSGLDAHSMRVGAVANLCAPGGSTYKV